MGCNCYLLLFIFCIIVTLCKPENKCDNFQVQKLCFDQETCDDCLQAHECCHWCYDQEYSERKCNIRQNLGGCSQEKIEINQGVNVTIPSDANRDFSKISKNTKIDDVIQMKPQHANIYLRVGVPVNISFSYKPAENYPLDLYYLGDLSASMQKSLEIFKTIGTDLPNNLTKLTENYKLAYGSFMDKIGMPFYFTDPERFQFPCITLGISKEDCDVGYLFKHRLNFTRNTEVFTQEIIKSKITANIDDLDGALDAIWQILICKNETGWSTNSRKIILLPTDSLLHLAGDGILVGAVRRLKHKCLLDGNGNHKEPLSYDYPSLGEIDRLLKDKKVNIIFAVKDNVKLGYYRNLTRDLIRDSSFVGKLEADSGNILELISRGYYNFARQVSFSVNTTMMPLVTAKLFADCENLQFFNECSTCYNVQNEEVKFIVQLTLTEQPATSGSDLFYIEEKNINERITLNVSYTGKCSCKNYVGKKKTCGNGDFVCGECSCNEGWTGPLCEEKCDNHDSNSCRMSVNDTQSFICNGNGDCTCGKCECASPFQGKFCEFECPVHDFEVCGGPSRGSCSEGNCICTEGFKGTNCSCSLATSGCKLFDATNLCGNNGDCICNECSCNPGFSGRYCEINKENNSLCEDYRQYVEDGLVNGTYKQQRNSVEIEIEEYEADARSPPCDLSSCTTVIFQGSSRCTVEFCYYAGSDRVTHLLAVRQCILTAAFKAISTGLSVFLAILLGGLLIIAVSKFRIYRLEQAEYRKFQNEQRLFNELNPIYKNPVTTYKNPLLKN